MNTKYNVKVLIIIFCIGIIFYTIGFWFDPSGFGVVRFDLAALMNVSFLSLCTCVFPALFASVFKYEQTQDAEMYLPESERSA